MLKLSVVTVLLLFFLLGCASENCVEMTSQPGNYPVLPDREVRNIILFIGDGMGMAQIYATQVKTVGASGKTVIEKLPVSGFSRTCSVDKLITDSAAGATAFACGFKTRNGMIGMTPDSAAVESILEAARTKGKATGLVVTSTVTHATPACFAAHWPSRRDEYKIAEQMIDGDVDIILGGGKKFFVPATVAGSRRPDSLNLINQAIRRGYTFVDKSKSLDSVSAGKILGLFADGPLPRNTQNPSLPQMTQKALNILSRDSDGFFLMVEGSQIDWGGHANDINYVIEEQLQFNRALEIAVEFAIKDKHTLIVVTADHETGGLHLKQGSVDGKDMQVTWTTGGHTGEPVPVFALGPYAHRFTGVIENTEIPVIFAKLWNISAFPQKLN